MGANRERRDNSVGGFARSVEVGAALMLQLAVSVEFQIDRVWVAGKQDAPSVGIGAFEGL